MGEGKTIIIIIITAQNIASSSQVRLLAFTWRNCFKQTGEGERRVHLVP